MCYKLIFIDDLLPALLLTGASNASATVHHNWRTARMASPGIAQRAHHLRLLIAHLLQEVQHGHCRAGHTVVRPAGELPM